jgi:hypothetical protein
MCPIPNGYRYLAPLSEACELVWSVSWLLWLLLSGPVILEDRMTGQNYLEFLKNELPEELEDVPLLFSYSL